MTRMWTGQQCQNGLCNGGIDCAAMALTEAQWTDTIDPMPDRVACFAPTGDNPVTLMSPCGETS